MVARILRFAPLVALVILTLSTFYYLYRAIHVDTHPDLSIGLDAAATTELKTLPDNTVSQLVANTHHEITSHSTPDGRYFRIDFRSRRGINPSIIPHPLKPNTWIITAQLHEPGGRRDKDSAWFAELVCDAVFQDKGRTLRCIDHPFILPIAATEGNNALCTGTLAFFALSIGPHDARVFYGPDAPYTIYGSNSAVTCFGQWILDFRLLVDWPASDTITDYGFRRATELQRPALAPYFAVEKNWFLFWDRAGNSYVHYDVAPTRAFAALTADGSVGADLAPAAASTDIACLQKYLPRMQDPDHESIHQATNSLAVTLCERADPNCHPDDSNTVILTIFQHKRFVAFHSSYEPYVMLFWQRAPFEIYGISELPVWIHGRGMMEGEEGGGNNNQTKMMYVTSIGWKSAGQKYHGYLDDVMFLAFGIEDADTAGVDVLAGDLVGGVGHC